MPTARRAPSATLVRRGGERLLIDCGEGTQRQLLRSDLGLVDLQEIFLTHFHADHFLGLPGMLKTFALRGRELPLTCTGRAAWTSCTSRCGGSSAGSPSRSPSSSSRRTPCCRATATRLRTFPARHGREAIGYALVEEVAPRPLRRGSCGRARGSARTRARRVAERRGGHARGRAGRHPGAGARRGSSRPKSRPDRGHGAVRPRRRGRVRGRPARPRGDLLRGRGRAGR